MSLKTKQHQIIYGIHAVHAALQRAPENIALLIIQSDRRDQKITEIITLANNSKIKLQQLSRLELDKLVGGENHQGIVVQYRDRQHYSEQDLPELITAINGPPLLLILDGVQDPHNLGACLRSANAAGVHAVIAPKDRAASLTSTVFKVASGAAEMTPFIAVTNLARTMRYLRDQGIWLFGLADDVSSNLYQADLRGPIALILGAEGEGLRRLTREHCDQILAIPMAGTVSSLNVSVATGICLFEAVRQRLNNK
jgi:23S rRNA (guanosine2251-2'-O)-methyltransferase